MTTPQGEVYDLGYQHYQGPREGRGRARTALWVNGIRTALGLGRGSLAKVLPALLFIAAMLPAVILAIVASQVDPDEILSHSGYYQIISIILLLFSAIIAPELLCSDRRDGVLSLYLVRPLTPTDYVAGRWLAFFTVTMAIVYSGQLLLLIGFTLAAADPLEHLRDNWLDIPRFLAAGFVLAAFTTTLPLAVSAFTTRRAYAAAFVIGLFLISAPTSGILTECEEGGNQQRGAQESGVTCEPLTGDAAKWFRLVNLGMVPIHVNDLIFGVEATLNGRDATLPWVVPVAWYLLLTAGPGAVLWWRYQRLRV